MLYKCELSFLVPVHSTGIHTLCMPRSEFIFSFLICLWWLHSLKAICHRECLIFLQVILSAPHVPPTKSPSTLSQDLMVLCIPLGNVSPFTP